MFLCNFLIHAKARRREILMIVYDTLDALFEGWRTEVDEQTKGQIKKTQIGKKLFVVNWGEFSTDFSSIMRQPSTNKSTRKPSSK